MADIESILELARDYNESVLVLDADATRLQKLLKPLAAPRTLILVDYRDHVPSNVFEELEGKLREDQIVHIAIGHHFHIRLLIALWDLRNRSSSLKGAVILSTTVSTSSELGAFKNAEERSELFPWVVGGGDHSAKWIPPTFRQAIVLIHGIGEQRPGHTFRSFADAVLPVTFAEESEKKYRSAPDDVSFDYRKLIALIREETQQHRGLNASIFTPRNTDFFEYYWAPKVEETTWQHVVGWAWLLLRRKPKTHLVAVWAVSWLFLCMGFVALVLGICASFTDQIAAWPAFTTSIASWFGLIILEKVVLRYLGDAARYLDENPSNEKIRIEIRRGCVELLGKLIRSRNYNRIVVVGHSLGSIIGYDALRHLWETEFWNAYEKGSVLMQQTALDEYESAAKELSSESDDEKIVLYQEKQSELLREVQALGNPWPVTDLITLASPLAHAPYLVPNYKRRRSDGELPENPPKAFESKFGSVSLGKRFTLSADFIEGKPRILGPNGLFAVTRWTNLYFPTRGGFFGDFVSGPLRSWFGNGIRDRKVSTKVLIRNLTMLAHVSYWYRGASSRIAGNRVVALDALIDALDLNGEQLGIPRFERSSW